MKNKIKNINAYLEQKRSQIADSFLADFKEKINSVSDNLTLEQRSEKYDSLDAQSEKRYDSLFNINFKKLNSVYNSYNSNNISYKSGVKKLDSLKENYETKLNSFYNKNKNFLKPIKNQ